jgi:hypothetical protein
VRSWSIESIHWLIAYESSQLLPKCITLRTYRFEVNSAQNFGICGVPTDLHAADRDQMAMFWGTYFSNKATYFLAFNFGPENVDNKGMQL